ncbi:MAG TPA: SRPBCC family protein [Fibrobacteria bacterium]|jgi:uncharacterized protein YndB with AHSA1/START domain|nr:SRPBCC family protein [Fibrobacteria bacterium]
MATFETSREIHAPAEKVFAAFSDPARLARWWGPAGFRNTFAVCEFKTGGRWVFTMHGPDGKDYPNESMFSEIAPPKRVVIDHVVEPKFRLTIALSETAAGTFLTWSQAFENAEVAKAIAPIVIPSNEQNLDRLVDEVLGA